MHTCSGNNVPQVQPGQLVQGHHISGCQQLLKHHEEQFLLLMKQFYSSCQKYNTGWKESFIALTNFFWVGVTGNPSSITTQFISLSRNCLQILIGTSVPFQEILYPLVIEWSYIYTDRVPRKRCEWNTWMFHLVLNVVKGAPFQQTFPQFLNVRHLLMTPIKLLPNQSH